MSSLSRMMVRRATSTLRLMPAFRFSQKRMACDGPAPTPIDEEVMTGWIRSHFPDHRSMQQRITAGRRRGEVMVGGGSFVISVTLRSLQPAGRRRWATGQPDWLHALAGTLLILGIVVVVAAVGHAWTSGRGRANRRSPLLALTNRQRRQVRRQALGQQPSLPADATFLRMLATRWSKPYHLAAFALGAVALLSGLAILSTQPIRTLASVLAAQQAVAVVVLLRRTTLARTFLKNHPAHVEHAGR